MQVNCELLCRLITAEWLLTGGEGEDKKRDDGMGRVTMMEVRCSIGWWVGGL